MGLKIGQGDLLRQGKHTAIISRTKNKAARPKSSFGELMEERTERIEGPVRLVQLPLSWRIEKDYGSYTLSYSSKDGRFWKQEGNYHSKAGSRAIARFKRDIAEAAAENPEIARKLRLYPELRG